MKHKCTDASGKQVRPCECFDAVNHPPHYAELQPEPIDVIEGWRLPFHLGNTIKYISRAGRKTADALTDLKKARWYLDRYIALLESGAQVCDVCYGTRFVWVKASFGYDRCQKCGVR